MYELLESEHKAKNFVQSIGIVRANSLLIIVNEKDEYSRDIVSEFNSEDGIETCGICNNDSIGSCQEC